MLVITRLLLNLQAGSLTLEGKLPDAYKLPNALPMAFRDLVLFLIFDSASIALSATDIPDERSGTPGTSSRSLFAQAQVQITWKRCKSSLEDSKGQLVQILSQAKKPRLSTNNFDMLSGEDLLTLIYANLQNRLLTEQGDFLPSELYTDYAIKMVSKDAKRCDYG